jgi:hypothetical protein
MDTTEMQADEILFQSPVMVDNKKKHLVLTSHDRLILYEKDPYSSLKPLTEWILELKYLVAGIDFEASYNIIKIVVN